MALTVSDHAEALPRLTSKSHLTTAPPVGFYLAFANADEFGNFQPKWDGSITPGLMAQLQEQGVSSGVSLGGDANFGPWVPPSDQAGWVSNATSSLAQIMETYSLTFLDIDYEGGPNGLDDYDLSYTIS